MPRPAGKQGPATLETKMEVIKGIKKAALLRDLLEKTLALRTSEGRPVL